MNTSVISVLRAFFFAFFFLLAMPAAPGAEPGMISLPKPASTGSVSIESALLKRHSIRTFSNAPLALSDLSQLLWAAQGVIGTDKRRTAPSAGALYPLEVSVVIGRAQGIETGIYRYRPIDHALRKVADGDWREELSSGARGQSPVRDAAAVLVISGVYERTTVKYGDRGVRYVHMEAGHAAQNVYLQAVSLNLGTVVVGAFDDDLVKKVARLPAQEQPLYLMPLGKPQGR